jgi:1-acyl-sn-glycerol-3-phosphate acyltransferase
MLFKLAGWKIAGNLPVVRRYICAVAPHTSNWDFIVGIAARSILRIRDAKFLGKSQLFKQPFGWFFRMIGGIPVYRDEHHDMVDQVAAIARNSDEFILGIAPEGTRKKVNKLKTGFWYIAKAADIPIVPVGFDYKLRQVVIASPVVATDLDKDIRTLIEFYKGITGKNPELAIE